MDQIGPDIIIAIDFGMTYTGVAYQKRQMDTPHVVKVWPGNRENTYKVPTELEYKGEAVYKWGFLCDDEIEPDTLHCEWFKKLLDPKELSREQRLHPDTAAKSMEIVKKWYTDYLRLIYKHTRSYIIPRLEGDGWNDTKIEFLFSLPTTWTSHTLIEAFRVIIRAAGFGSESTKHSFDISLTEAEAAAVYTAKNQTESYKEGDIMLICDAGGGTTDISILKTHFTQSTIPSLEQLIPVQGGNFGSTNIDIGFENIVKDRLNIKDPLQHEKNKALAFKAIKSRTYLTIKNGFGGGGYDEYPELRFSIYDDPTINCAAANIQKGKLILKKDEFEKLFIDITEKMITLVDKQLAQLRDRYPKEAVKYLVLSGGLGSSPYIQNKIKERYKHSFKVLLSDEPQEAVVRGLVIDRYQRFRSKPVITTRCCRASYGILCNREYDEKNATHLNRPTYVDPLDGKRYVTNMIQWFIRKGDPVSADSSIPYNFYRNIKPGDPNRKWVTKVVKSSIPGVALPPSLHQDGAEVVCQVESDLSDIKEEQFRKVKKKQFLKSKTNYYKAEYAIRVVIGPADIRFELEFQGKNYSNGERIDVEWMNTPMEDEKINDIPNMYGDLAI